jgi:sulfatase modifying factor 1
MRISRWIVAAVSVAALAPAAAVCGDGIDFVTIGAAGNAGYPLASPPGHLSVQGRGAVAYEYRIGRYEVTTAQWLEFANNCTTQGGQWAFFALPTFWGAVPDPTYSGPGARYMLNPNLPGAASMPVYGITWRESAMYCNWLHNDRAPGLSSIMDGAYDASTFTTNPDQTFNDQRTRSPGARYWIPSLDEWLKAAHYDPNRYGQGQPGWWEYPHGSDEAPIGGVPGVGQTNAGFSLPNAGHYRIPLGSYPQTLSPWGLLDATGEASEHTEFYWPPEAPVERLSKGSAALASPELFDVIYATPYWNRPGTSFSGVGFRVAGAVPTPGTCLVLGALMGRGLVRRRRAGAGVAIGWR